MRKIIMHHASVEFGMSSDSSQPQPARPGRGLFGWLGRQVGYVTKALKTDVTEAKSNTTVYRDEKVEEHPLPEDPNVILRRTTIDEVIQRQGQPCDNSD
jgi:hypothetical protein